MKYILICLSMLLVTGTLMSQSDFLGYGFRAGMSLAKVDGPSETGPNGEVLEKNKMASGFHIGVTINYKFSDIMGLRSEFLYSQRGTDYTYDGPSKFLLGRSSLQPVIISGTRRQTLNVSNSYIDIPLTAYYKLGYFELSGGLNTGILIASAAGGTIEFNGISPNGNAVAPFEVNLNYNYKSDDPGFASSVSVPVSVDGITQMVPEFVGAYYEFAERDKSFYKTLDFGLSAGLAYFLNDGLYLSAKYIHGLGDVDRNFYDVSLQNINPDGTLIPRADINKSRSYQFSVGFSF